MESSSIISHPNRSPSGWLKAMIPVLFLLLGIGTQSAWAQDLDFFPLQIGNTWTYVDSNRTPPDFFTVTITDTQRVEGRTYSVLQGVRRLLGPLGEESLYRKDASGDVFVYYPAQQRDCLRFRFSGVGDLGDLWDTWVDSCAAFYDLRGPFFWDRHAEDLSSPQVLSWLSVSQIFTGGRKGVRLSFAGFEEFTFASSIGIVLRRTELAGRSSASLIDAVVNGVRVRQPSILCSTSWGAVKSQVR